MLDKSNVQRSYCCRVHFHLSNFACYPGAQLAGKALISPDQLRAQLKGLAEQRILAVLVVDLLDCSGSFLTRVRDLVGRNPVLLIGTKVSVCCSTTMAT